MKTTKPDEKTRVSPSCCSSAFCGKIECPADCKNLSILNDFYAWRKRTAAIREEEIWCPSVWTATKLSA